MAGLPFTCFPLQHTPDSTLSLFGCSSSVACAGVASHSIPVAITAQLVQWLGFWVAGASQLRARRHVSAEKLEPESHSTSAFKMWTWLDRALSTTAVWRSWRMACLCSTGLIKQWTRLWCLCSEGTGRHCATTDVAALETARRRKETTYPELSGQFGRTKLLVLAAGPESAAVSSASWPKLKCGERLHTSEPVPDRRGTRGGACSAARAVALSLLERRGSQCSDGVTPSTSDVLADAKYAPA